MSTRPRIESATFTQRWPALEERLARFLRSKGCDPSTSEDLSQEVGLRLFKMWERVDPQSDAWPLTVTIALNLLRDSARSSGRLFLVEEPPETSSGTDTETVAIARLELRRVGRALKMMNPRYRSLLLNAAGADEPMSRDDTAVRMARSRARTRLQVLLERVSSGVAGLGRTISNRLRGFETLGVSGLSEATVQLIVSATIVATAGSGGSFVPAPALDLSAVMAVSPVKITPHDLAVRTTRTAADLASAGISSEAVGRVRQQAEAASKDETWTPVTVDGHKVTTRPPNGDASVGGDGVRAHAEGDVAGHHVEESPEARPSPSNCTVYVDAAGNSSADCDP